MGGAVLHRQSPYCTKQTLFFILFLKESTTDTQLVLWQARVWFEFNWGSLLKKDPSSFTTEVMVWLWVCLFAPPWHRSLQCWCGPGPVQCVPLRGENSRFCAYVYKCVWTQGSSWTSQRNKEQQQQHLIILVSPSLKFGLSLTLEPLSCVGIPVPLPCLASKILYAG